MQFKSLFLCAALGFGCVDMGAHAQQAAPTRSDLIEMMSEMEQLGQSRQEFERLGFKGEQLELAVRHDQLLLKDKVISGYIADRLLALYNGNLPNGWAPDGLLSPLFYNGYTNLSRSDKVFYFRVQTALLKAMPTRDCGMLIKGRMNERRLNRTISQAEARLSPAMLKRYYDLQRNAIRMGINKSPKALSTAESARIQEKLNAELRKRLESDPALAPVASAFDNMNRASTTNACRAGVFLYDVALDMKGRDLDSVLIYLNE